MKGELARLWTALLAGPLAWLAMLEADYALAGWACTRGRHAVLHVVTAAALSLALGGGAMAWTAWRRRRDEAEPLPTAARRFIALMGLGLSAAFAVAIVAGAIPPLILHDCD
jgi:hypothetical protein